MEEEEESSRPCLEWEVPRELLLHRSELIPPPVLGFERFEENKYTSIHWKSGNRQTDTLTHRHSQLLKTGPVWACLKNIIYQALDGNCLEKNIIYQATVREAITKKEETYIGRTATSFKERYNNHKSSFKNRHLINGCELGKHIWKLKDQNIEVESIKWKILGRSKPFSPVSNVCNLCVKEKYFILYKPELGSLNKRTELTAGCRHKTKQLLVKN